MSETQLESIVRGDDTILNITITDPNGLEVDISGDKLWFTVKSDPKEADQLAPLRREMIVPTDADSALGLAKMQLTSEDTDINSGLYQYDLQWQRIVSGNSEIITPQYGKVRFIQHVTHATE